MILSKHTLLHPTFGINLLFPIERYSFPETTSPLETSDYSLYYQLYCWKLCIFQSQILRLLPVIFVFNGE
jgi:hypothetical protein